MFHTSKGFSVLCSFALVVVPTYIWHKHGYDGVNCCSCCCILSNPTASRRIREGEKKTRQEKRRDEEKGRRGEQEENKRRCGREGYAQPRLNTTQEYSWLQEMIFYRTQWKNSKDTSYTVTYGSRTLLLNIVLWYMHYPLRSRHLIRPNADCNTTVNRAGANPPP